MVDVGHPRFDFQSTAGSSVVNGAWYDADNDYLIIALNDRFYHYCRVPDEVWSGFEAATSYGRYYNETLRGSYDCRSGEVPDYEEP